MRFTGLTYDVKSPDGMAFEYRLADFCEGVRTGKFHQDWLVRQSIDQPWQRIGDFVSMPDFVQRSAVFSNSQKQNWTGRYFKTMGLAFVALIGISLLFFRIASIGSAPRGPGPAIYVGLAIWKIGFVLVAVRVAREKGRSQILWGIVELLSSLIGTIILLLLPYTRERKAEMYAMEQGLKSVA